MTATLSGGVAMTWETAELAWSLTQRDMVLTVIMVGILFVGMYVLFRLLLVAREAEPILGEEETNS